ncbi:hypothetical protein HWV62_6721 [Athelia sp. TMB]|nr:hypothetical protein HWV62_6721 [Athelia sp. TMB]
MDIITEVIRPNSRFKSLSDGFFHPGNKTLFHFLNVVGADPRGQKKLESWKGDGALDVVVKRVAKEMDSLSLAFKMSAKDLTPEFLSGFDLDTSVTDVLADKSPWLQKILLAAAQTKRSERENTIKRVDKSCSLIHAQLSNLRSSNSQACQLPVGYFFYSSGVSRRVMDTVSRIGLTPSYATVHEGHIILANGQMERARVAARSKNGHMTGWDNTQITTSIHVEQRSLAPPKVQTGTTSIIYALRNSSPAAIQLKPILELRKTCPIITFADIRPTSLQTRAINRQFVLEILNILLNHEDGFDYIDKSDSRIQPHSYRPPPKKYKTQEFVLRTTKIDEGSTDGNIEVAREQYFDQLGFKDHELDDAAIPSIHDQSTNAKVRAGQILRKGDTNMINHMACFMCGIGWFHVQLNLLWALLHIHRGMREQIGSLQYFIVLLGRTRMGSAKPDFNTMRSLATQVLAGNILSYWKVATGGATLAQFAATKPTIEALLLHAESIYSNWVSEKALRMASGTPGVGGSNDGTKHNTVLLNRDFLMFFVLSSAISSGDFGRVEILQGPITMMFSGAGCRNYSTEFLHWIQNLKYGWTPDFANVMRDNSLINMSGRDNHYTGVDKNAETNINFQKDYLAAKGVHGTFDMLANLAPNIPLYRRLKRQLAGVLGTPWGGTSHTVPDFTKAINQVMNKIRDVQLAEFQTGRTTPKLTVNILQKGGETLQNSAISSFQKRWRLWAAGKVDLEDPEGPEEDDIEMLRQGSAPEQDGDNE